MKKNKDFQNIAISPDEQALQALKIIAGKLGELSGSLKRLHEVSYKMALALHGIVNSFKDHQK